MPTIRELINFDSLPVQEVEERRRKLTEKARAAGGPNQLSDDELMEWLECTSQLRRRHAGPSKKTKTPKGPVTAADL